MPNDPSSRPDGRLSPMVERLPGLTPAGVLGRPINGYAVIGERSSILVDAPFEVCLEALRRLEARGLPPQAMVLTSGNTVCLGDAYGLFSKAFGLSFHVHPAARDGIAGDLLQALPEAGEDGFLGLEVVEFPASPPTDILLYLPKGRALFVGDHVGTPRPDKEGRADAKLCIPEPETDAADYLIAWQIVLAELEPDLVLPSQGPALSRNALGSRLDRALTPTHLARGNRMLRLPQVDATGTRLRRSIDIFTRGGSA